MPNGVCLMTTNKCESECESVLEQRKECFLCHSGSTSIVSKRCESLTPACISETSKAINT